MGSFGPPELLIVLLIVVVLFGGAKLPKLARSLREAKDEFDKPSKGDAKVDAKALKNGTTSDGDEKVTMSKAELDALLAERELRAKQD